MDKLIKIDDIEGKVYEIDNWKPSRTPTVQKYFSEKYNEIEREYKKLCDELKWNKIIYQCEIMFTPVIGKEYYLYQDINERKFLSLIAPEDWTKKSNIRYIGTFKQDSRFKWNKV